MTENEPFIRGAFSGLIQNAICHPLDTIKTNLQNNIINKNINYYKGIYSSSIISFISTGINFSTFKRINDVVENNYMSGLITGVITSVITNPLEIYKVKSQTNNNINIQNINIQNIKNMYNGYNILLLRESIGNSIYFGTYYYMREKEFSIFNSGGISGMLSWLITYPIDIIKTRVQVNNISYSESIRQGYFFKGLSYCLLRAYLSNSIGFLVYEKLK